MPQELHRERLINYLREQHEIRDPRVMPTDDTGKRQQQIDRAIANTAVRDFIQSLADEFSLRELIGPDHREDHPASIRK